AFGCVPAWRASRANALEALRSGAGAGTRRRGLLGAFVSAQVALAVVMLVGTGLMLRTMVALDRIQPGFDPSHADTFDVSLPATPGTSSAQTRARVRAFDAAISALPGVEAETATLGSRPMIHDSSLPFWIQGQPKPATDNAMPQALLYLAEGGYQRAMGLTLERGRFLTDRDDEHAPVVMVIDDVFARRYFPGQDPIGRQINLTGFEVRAQIVGVVGHVKQWGLQADPRTAIEAQFYYPVMQVPDKLFPLLAGTMAVVVRTAGDPDAIIAPVRQALRRVDPREVVFAAESLESLLDESVAARRSTLRLLGLFGALALGLASLGTYGVIAYLVGRRRREIGLRMALGGQRGDVLALVLGDTLRLALWGVGAGLAAALLLSRFLSGLLYGVSAADPLTYAAVAALLMAVALLAGCLPARQALRISPTAALRAE
ncbi:MAG: ABC transporter permease, partial [Terriglobales bacterium]